VAPAGVGAEGKDVHGDVGESEKNRIRDHYPDILVTTPESLEVMLISARPEAREMFKGVRLVSAIGRRIARTALVKCLSYSLPNQPTFSPRSGFAGG